MEEVAYTRFNRLVVLRYMAIHELLDHGHRVLSSRDGGLPELLRHAAEVSLPGRQASRTAVTLLAWAIEQLGDGFAIAGFHSNTRHDVRYQRVQRLPKLFMSLTR